MKTSPESEILHQLAAEVVVDPAVNANFEQSIRGVTISGAHVSHAAGDGISVGSRNANTPIVDIENNARIKRHLESLAQELEANKPNKTTVELVWDELKKVGTKGLLLIVRYLLAAKGIHVEIDQ
jgi:hypothetical protein